MHTKMYNYTKDGNFKFAHRRNIIPTFGSFKSESEG